MTDLIALAKQAGGSAYTNLYPDEIAFSPKELQAFADLIRQQEREELAVFFESHWRDRWTDKEIVEAIRARGTT